MAALRNITSEFRTSLLTENEDVPPPVLNTERVSPMDDSRFRRCWQRSAREYVRGAGSFAEFVVVGRSDEGSVSLSTRDSLNVSILRMTDHD